MARSTRRSTGAWLSSPQGDQVAVCWPGSCTSWPHSPRLDGDPTPETLGDSVDDLIRAVTDAGTARREPKLRLLPDRITLDDVLAQSRPEEEGTRGWCWRSTRRSSPRWGWIRTEPHLLIFGDGQSGKSATLRAYCRRIMRTAHPGQAQIVVVDYRRFPAR